MSTMSTIQMSILMLLVIFAAILLGYATGRRAGMKQGRQLGAAQAPLSLRRQALQSGQCPICDTVCEADVWNVVSASDIDGEYGSEQKQLVDASGTMMSKRR
jgi:hypothetical protein